MASFVDLLLDNGELIRIETPDKHYDSVMEAIENGMKIGDWWCVDRYDGTSATYLGHPISRVNMKRVVAML